MGVIRNVNFTIAGQVSDDYRDDDYKVLRKELELICARYNLRIKDNFIEGGN